MNKGIIDNFKRFMFNNLLFGKYNYIVKGTKDKTVYLVFFQRYEQAVRYHKDSDLKYLNIYTLADYRKVYQAIKDKPLIIIKD